MATNKSFAGIEKEDEIQSQAILRNTKTPGQKIIDGLSDATTLSTTIAACAIPAYLWQLPFVPELCLIAGLLLTRFGLNIKSKLPFRMPMSAGVLDWNDLHPGTGKPVQSRGIGFYGNRLKDDGEIWFSDDDLRTHILIFGSTGSGKAQPMDAKVLTPKGWVRMGDVWKGMRVCTPDGKSAVVDGIYPQGEMDIYEIEFEDGRKTRATAEHLWEVHNKGWKGREHIKGVFSAELNVPRVLTTSDIEHKIHNFPKQKYSVRLPIAHYNSNNNSLPIHPYVLGAMLGNGNFSERNFRFSVNDPQIKATFESFLPEELSLKNYKCDASCDYWILQKESNLGRAVNGDYYIMPMKMSLKTMGLWNKKSHDKFIPVDYLESSFENRMLLIQGMMDNDGNAGIKGSISYSTASKVMAEQFQQLVWSVGGIAKISEKNTTFTYLGEKKVGRVSYQINIRHNDLQSFFKSTKKALRVKDHQYAGKLRLAFKSITKVGVEHAQCIHIDHPDHLYITDNFITTHNTEALLSFAYNSLAQGSGFIYVDGKGDNSLWAKIYGMVRNRGREDDLLVINYMTGNADVSEGPKSTRLSNTTNPFANLSSDGATQLVVGLMDGGEKGGDMWKGRATSMMSGLLMALVSMRDRGDILLDVQVIREYMNIEKIIGLAKDDTLPEKAKNSLKAYLDSLPGFIWKKGANQGDTTLEQHGYLQMQFTKIMGSLSDTYGHIFRTQLGEVDFYDVVVNRRILVVLLPALEKAPDELANLGKIIVASLKSMMATGLGAGIEGTFKDVIEAKPNNSPSPFTTILDEYGYYAVPGSAVMPAQARSLGFSMIFAGQDLPAFEKASPEEAASIIGNCNIKIFMKLEESEKTFTLFDKSVGEAYVTHTGGFQSTTGLLGNVYQDGSNASIERRSRGNITDLQKQQPGEAHMLFGGSVVRVRLFRANPPTPRNMMMMVNRFLKILPPSKEQMDSFTENSKMLIENLTNNDFIESLQAPSQILDITFFSKFVTDHYDKPAAEIGIYALAEYRIELDKAGGTMELDEDDDGIDNLEGFMPDDNGSNMFGDKKSEELFLTELLGAEGAGDMAAMMGDDAGYLNRNSTKKGIADIEMALGADQESANRVGESVIKSIDDTTGYPSEPVEQVEVEDWIEAMKEIDGYISSLDGSAKEEIEE